MLKIEMTSRLNPWDIITCPICEGTDFVSIDHAAVYCEQCNTRFQIRPTAGDPGLVADAFTDETWHSDAKHPELIDLPLYKIVKEGEDDREWLVSNDSTQYLGPISHYLGKVREPNTIITGAWNEYEREILLKLLPTYLRGRSLQMDDDPFWDILGKLKHNNLTFNPDELDFLKVVLQKECDKTVLCGDQSYHPCITTMLHKLETQPLRAFAL